MNDHSALLYLLIFLGAAVIVIPVFKKLGLSSVLGYLFAGTLIGPSVLNLVPHTEELSTLAEFGVVFLLFIIGIELKPSRLWVMRKVMLTTGLSQILLCVAFFYLVLTSFNFAPTESFLVAFAISLSSTALVLQMLSELNQISSLHGRQAFSVLLFQDIVVIPVLAAMPFMASGSNLNIAAPNLSSLLILLCFVIFFHFASRPLLRFMANVGLRELFTSFALLMVVGVAYLMHSIHLSMELGAFIAGILLSESEYRHQLESDIEPFKGLLLGLFFMGIGMQLEAHIVIDSWKIILMGAITLVLTKSLIITIIAKVTGLPGLSSLKLATSLSQGGEFAFVLLALGGGLGIIGENLTTYIPPIVTLSMIMTPVIFTLIEKIAGKIQNAEPEREADKIEKEHSEVILVGLGRFGQIPARILRSCGIEFTALDHDPKQVETLRKFGNQVFYGDATRLDLLHSAGADKAKLIIISIGNEEKSLKIIELVKKHFPHLRIIARARNRNHVFELKEIGIEHSIRETFESALSASKIALGILGHSEGQSKSIIDRFRSHDEELLLQQAKIFRSEKELIETSHKAFQQLLNTMKQDASQTILPPVEKR